MDHTKWMKLTVGSLGIGATYQKIVGLDVAVDEVLLMDGLYTTDHLTGGHTNGLDRKFPSAHIKEILQAWTK